MKPSSPVKLTIFYCVNSFQETAALNASLAGSAEPTYVKMACSSMVKDVFLLRAFEAGADAVVVLVCPQKQCRHVEGNTRARKRVAWVQGLLDEIGLDGRRLALHPLDREDPAGIAAVLADTVAGLAALGPTPVV